MLYLKYFEIIYQKRSLHLFYVLANKKHVMRIFSRSFSLFSCRVLLFDLGRVELTAKLNFFFLVIIYTIFLFFRSCSAFLYLFAWMRTSNHLGYVEKLKFRFLLLNSISSGISGKILVFECFHVRNSRLCTLHCPLGVRWPQRGDTLYIPTNSLLYFLRESKPLCGKLILEDCRDIDMCSLTIICFSLALYLSPSLPSFLLFLFIINLWNEFSYKSINFIEKKVQANPSATHPTV